MLSFALASLKSSYYYVNPSSHRACNVGRKVGHRMPQGTKSDCRVASSAFVRHAPFEQRRTNISRELAHKITWNVSSDKNVMFQDTRREEKEKNGSQSYTVHRIPDCTKEEVHFPAAGNLLCDRDLGRAWIREEKRFCRLPEIR